MLDFLQLSKVIDLVAKYDICLMHITGPHGIKGKENATHYILHYKSN